MRWSCISILVLVLCSWVFRLRDWCGVGIGFFMLFSLIGVLCVLMILPWVLRWICGLRWCCICGFLLLVFGLCCLVIWLSCLSVCCIVWFLLNWFDMTRLLMNWCWSLLWWLIWPRRSTSAICCVFRCWLYSSVLWCLCD